MSFSVTTAKDVMMGTDITNEATIYFDNMDPIRTNRWENTATLEPETPTLPRPEDSLEPPVSTDVTLQWKSQLSTSFDLYLWRASDPRPASPVHASVEYYHVPDRLVPGATYRWQVVGYRDGHGAEGPVWSFRTAGGRFLRGDADATGARNLSDAIYSLSFLFVGGPGPPCEESADANDSGDVNLSDPIYLLAFLFLGGPPPPPPFESCDEDATPDDLGCVTYPPCE